MYGPVTSGPAKEAHRQRGQNCVRGKAPGTIGGYNEATSLVERASTHWQLLWEDARYCDEKWQQRLIKRD